MRVELVGGIPHVVFCWFRQRVDSVEHVNCLCTNNAHLIEMK